MKTGSFIVIGQNNTVEQAFMFSWHSAPIVSRHSNLLADRTFIETVILHYSSTIAHEYINEHSTKYKPQ